MENKTRAFPALFVQVRRPYQALKYSGAKLIVKAKVAAAGLPPRFTPHKLRHTFATRLLRNRVELEQIQLLLGHANVATTQIYAHGMLSDETRRRLGEVL